MCEICGSIPCNSRCPNASDPEIRGHCEQCGEELVEGVRQFFWCHSSRFGILWFLTREEAEKRLKELQNG